MIYENGTAGQMNLPFKTADYRRFIQCEKNINSIPVKIENNTQEKSEKFISFAYCEIDFVSVY